MKDLSILISLAVIGIAALVGILSVTVFKGADQNPIEQAAEEVIQAETGAKEPIDLTPVSERTVVPPTTTNTTVTPPAPTPPQTNKS